MPAAPTRPAARARTAHQDKGAYRKVLERRHGKAAVSSLRLHVGHIVSAGMGGADHPHNYAMMDAGLNLSFGMFSDDLLAALVGLERTRRAVAASEAVGAAAGKPYAGPTAEQLYWLGAARLRAALAFFGSPRQAAAAMLAFKKLKGGMWARLDALPAAAGELGGGQ